MARTITINADSADSVKTLEESGLYFHSGDDLEIKVTPFKQGEIATDVTSLTVRLATSAGATAWSVTETGVDLDTGITLTEWRAGAAFGTFDVDAVDNSLARGRYRLFIYGQDGSGDQETFLQAEVEIQSPPEGDGTVIDPPDPIYLTTVQAAAQYAPIGVYGAQQTNFDTRLTIVEDETDANTSAIATLGTLGSVTAYADVADLPGTTNSSGNPILAYVYADATEADRGLYSQADGSSTWVQVTGDLATRIADLELLSTDESERILALLLSELGLANGDADLLTDYFPLYADGDGRVNIKIEKTTGKLWSHLHRETMTSGGVDIDTDEHAIIVSDEFTDIPLAEIDSEYYVRPIGTLAATDYPETDIDAFAVCGQSRAYGLASLPVIKTSSDYSNNYRLNNGPRRWNGTYTAFSALLESSDGTNGETISTAFADALVLRMFDEGGIPTSHTDRGRVLGAVGVSGWGITRLMKNNLSFPVFYNYLTTWMTGTVTAAQAAGKTVSMPAIIWMHGQADASSTVKMPRKLYRNFMVKYREDAEADAHATYGGQRPLLMVSDQDGTNSINYPDICLAQRDATLYDSQVILSHPTYCIPFVDSNHHSAGGQDLAGFYFARAYYNRAVNGVARPWLEAVSWLRQDDIVTIQYAGNDGDLVIDPTTLGAVTDSGFNAYDDGVAVTINSVTAVRGNCVTIVLNSTPSGTFIIDYALHNAVTGSAATTTGGGTLRDSSAETVTYDSVTYNCYNWAIAQRLTF